MEISMLNQRSGISNIASQSVTAKGSDVVLKTADARHFSGKVGGAGQDDDVAQSFSDVLNQAIGKTNNLQVESENLTRKMIYEPESVDVHTVMIAQQKAEVAMTFTKAVRDEAIRAYREIMNLR